MTAGQPHTSVRDAAPHLDLVTYHQFREDIWFHYRVPGHHLLLVERGCIEALGPTGGFHARAGDLVCFRPTDWNQYGTRGETIYYDAHVHFFPGRGCDPTPFFDGTGPLPLCLALGDGWADARQVFETLCCEVGSPCVASEIKIRAALLELLALVARLLAPEAPPARLVDPWRRVELEILGASHEQLRVGILARRLGVSSEHFARRFKQRFGTSPKAYHTRARLREALRLLRLEGHSVKSVAGAVGYRDTRAFSRQFAAQFGVRPSDVRGTPAPVVPLEGQLENPVFPINRHMLPAEARPDWFKDYFPRGCAGILTSERRRIVEKIVHPENLAECR